MNNMSAQRSDCHKAAQGMKNRDKNNEKILHLAVEHKWKTNTGGVVEGSMDQIKIRSMNSKGITTDWTADVRHNDESTRKSTKLIKTVKAGTRMDSHE